MTPTTVALQVSKVCSTMPSTSSAIKKRANKPLMEKRRRARINQSLSDLRNLILDYLKKESTRSSKLEKADILEATLQYVQELQRGQTAVSITADPSISNKYQAGYNECVKEVRRYLRSSSDAGLTDPSVSHRVMAHITDTRCRSRALKHAEKCVQLKKENLGSHSTTQSLQSSDQRMIFLLKTPIVGNFNNQLSPLQSAMDSTLTAPSDTHLFALQNVPAQLNTTESRLTRNYDFMNNGCSPSRRNKCDIMAQLGDGDTVWRPW